MSHNLKAVINLNKSVDVNQIKRLALFFDEILYILPKITAISETVLTDRKRVTIDNKGGRHIRNFNFYKDTHQAWQLQLDSLDAELKELILAFEENGIAKECPILSQEHSETDKQFVQARNIMAASDINDKQFRKLSKTTPEDLDINKRLLRLTIRKDNGEELKLHVINEPNAIFDSFQISNCLYIAGKFSAAPVFLNYRNQGELEYRYSQYKKGLAKLREVDSSISESDFMCNFGEIALGVANSVFSSDLLVSKGPREIIKYRNSMEESRLQFLSKDLLEVTDLLKNNPWDAKTKLEVEKYISGKLWNDIQMYNNKSKEIWEKLYGNIAIKLAELSKSVAIGGSAGGILGSVIPNASSSELLLLGALAVASKEAPKIVKDLVDTILEVRKLRRTSIAYIAKFH